MNNYINYLIDQYKRRTEQYKRDLGRKKEYEKKGYVVELEYEEGQCRIDLACLWQLELCIFSYIELKNISKKAKSDAEKQIDALVKDRQAFERSLYDLPDSTNNDQKINDATFR